MSKPRLVYFDFAGSRGEECRIALHLAGIDFEDVRIQRADWPAMKAGTPFGSLPVLEIPGKPALAQSNAILNFIAAQHGLHELQAALAGHLLGARDADTHAGVDAGQDFFFLGQPGVELVGSAHRHPWSRVENGSYCICNSCIYNHLP